MKLQPNIYAFWPSVRYLNRCLACSAQHSPLGDWPFGRLALWAFGPLGVWPLGIWPLGVWPSGRFTHHKVILLNHSESGVSRRGTSMTCFLGHILPSSSPNWGRGGHDSPFPPNYGPEPPDNAKYCQIPPKPTDTSEFRLISPNTAQLLQYGQVH